MKGWPLGRKETGLLSSAFRPANLIPPSRDGCDVTAGNSGKAPLRGR